MNEVGARTGGPLTFLVLRRAPGWVEVALPVRPNGSTGWVAERDVRLAVTPYRLVVGRDVSHGCLRVSDDVIRRLAGTLPLGTPVDII